MIMLLRRPVSVQNSDLVSVQNSDFEISLCLLRHVKQKNINVRSECYKTLF